MDEKRRRAGQKLMDVAYEFWEACHEEGQYGAVQWLTGTNGELLIFTRGEYREHLMTNIHILPNIHKIHFFSEDISSEEEEEAACHRLIHIGLKKTGDKFCRYCGGEL
jgi:hypothetical protein